MYQYCEGISNKGRSTSLVRFCQSPVFSWAQSTELGKPLNSKRSWLPHVMYLRIHVFISDTVNADTQFCTILLSSHAGKERICPTAATIPRQIKTKRFCIHDDTKRSTFFLNCTSFCIALQNMAICIVVNYVIKLCLMVTCLFLVLRFIVRLRSATKIGRWIVHLNFEE